MNTSKVKTAYAVVNHEGTPRVFKTLGRVVDFLVGQGVVACGSDDKPLSSGHELRFEIETCKVARFYTLHHLPGSAIKVGTLRYRVTEHDLSTGELA